MAERYKIYEQLGAGGVGTVFRAYDTQLKRWVAIKRLMTRREGEQADAELREELRQEADSLATLRNPHIVTIFDVASDDEGLFIVMELLEGEDLLAAVSRGPLPFEDFRELAYQTLEGLLAAHQKHILHRDIKPENIKIERLASGRLQAKLIDFGLARIGLKARKQTEDVQGTVMGSIHFMAPEQLTRSPVDERTDLYSLGCVFYQALSGRKAFDGPTMTDVIEKHLKHYTIPLHVIAPHVPQWLGEWVESLMALDPNDRPAGAQQALASFQTLERASTFAHVPDDGLLPDATPTDVVHPTSQPVPIPTLRPTRVVTPGTPSSPVLATVSSAITAAAPVRTAAEARSLAASRVSSNQAPAGRSSQPTTQRKVQPKVAATPVDSKKVLLLSSAGFIVLAGILWWVFAGESSPSPPPTPTPSPSVKSKNPPKPPRRASVAEKRPEHLIPKNLRRDTEPWPSTRELPPLADDRCLHVIADHSAYRPVNSLDETAILAAVGEPVGEWRDLAPRGKDNMLRENPHLPSPAPVRIEWAKKYPGSNVLPERTVLDFSLVDLSHSISLENSVPWVSEDWFPFGSEPVTGPSGMTLAVVFQEDADAAGSVLCTLAGKFPGALMIKSNSENQLTVNARINQDTKEIVAPTISPSQPTIAVVVWDGTTGRLHLTGVNAPTVAGGEVAVFQSTSETVLGPLTTPVSRFRIGQHLVGGASGTPFSGVVAEVILYSVALNPDQARTLAVEQLARNYFK